MPLRPPPSASACWVADVLVRPSPWRLGAADADLAAEWLTGWLDAACKQVAELAAGVRRIRRPPSGAGPRRAARRHRRPRRPAGAAVTTTAVRNPDGALLRIATRSDQPGGASSISATGWSRSPWRWARPAGAGVDARSRRLAAWRGPVPRRRPRSGRPSAGGRGGHRPADHPLLCLAVDDRGARPRRPAVAAGCRRRVLPVAVPQPHAPRRGRRRRSPRRQPWARRATTSAVGCGRSHGSAPPGRLCRS